MRRIFHIDMNSFFASCEIARNPELKDKHIAVCGDPKKRSGMVLAASYSAKAFGIKTTMPIWKAVKLCPDLIILPCDFHLYSSYSHKMIELISEYAPVIEQASIDEAYIDLTGTENMYPDLYKLAEEIQGRILNELGLKCSIGISENKLLAKMGSDYKKPLGITEIYLKDVPDKLWHLNVGDLLFIGKKTEEALKQIGIYSIGDLAKYDMETLKKIFGEKSAIRMIESANGIDDSEVLPNDMWEAKSNGAERTFEKDIDDMNVLKNELFKMSERIAKNLREMDKKSRTICLKIKYENFESITRNMTLPKPICISNDIYEAACDLLEKNWDHDYKIRLIGVSATNFIGEEDEDDFSQISLFDMKEDTVTAEKKDKLNKLDNISDLLRNKYGDNIVVRAKTIIKNKEDEEGEDDE